MKTCNKCNQTKPLTEFNKDKNTKDGLSSQCKVCKNEQQKQWRQTNKERITKYNQNSKERIAEYYQNNKERIAKYQKEYRQNNKEYIAQRDKEYYQTNKERIAQRDKEYRQNNKENISKRDKKYRQNNKERITKLVKQWRQNNKEYIAQVQKEYIQNNREKINKQRLEYITNRYHNDELFRIIVSIRACIRSSISRMGYTKRSKTQQILGCSFEEFKLHIENQFAPGMSWDNKHLWHLDHIIPVSLGLTEEEIIALNHYTNFQPLWAEDNRSKGNNTNWEKDPTKYNTPEC